MQDLALQCRCGKVKGTVHNVTPEMGTHLACYCLDCQNFAKELGEESSVLNEYGGTRLVHLPPASVTLDSGKEHVACLRLTKRGSHRWYTTCCNTAIGYTVRPWVPFIGIIHSFIPEQDNLDGKIGPLLGSVNMETAKGEVPRDVQGEKTTGPVMLQVFKRLLNWLFTGKGKPSPVYLKGGKTIVEPKVVSK